MKKWMPFHNHLIFGFFAIILSVPVLADELLHFDFNDSNHLVLQSGALPLGESQGDVKPSLSDPGAVEFGSVDGSIRVPTFHSPTGPYTVEARFLIHEYGPESSNFIANIFNTVPEVHQGFAFRVGGGYVYPPLPRNAYKTESEWLSAQGEFSWVARERLSDCFAAFTMADNQGGWKEVYTDRCIDKNTWTHLVGIWDGTNMRIYLNGMDATDIWRVQGFGTEPFLGGEVEAYIGSRTFSEFDPRHLHGALDYIKVEDGVLSDAEIHRRYNESFVPRVRDSLCMGVVIPQYPEAGQLCKGKLDLEFKLINHGACTDPAFLAAFLAGDSVEVEIAKNATFTDPVFHAVVALTTLHLEAKDLPGLAGYKGALYWRVRLIHSKRSALAKSTASIAEDWSFSRPLVLDMSEVTGIRMRHAFLKPVFVQSQFGLFIAGDKTSSAPVLMDPAGRRQSVQFQRVAGGWSMSPRADGRSGLFFIVK